MLGDIDDGLARASVTSITGIKAMASGSLRETQHDVENLRLDDDRQTNPIYIESKKTRKPQHDCTARRSDRNGLLERKPEGHRRGKVGLQGVVRPPQNNPGRRVQRSLRAPQRKTCWGKPIVRARLEDVKQRKGRGVEPVQTDLAE